MRLTGAQRQAIAKLLELTEIDRLEVTIKSVELPERGSLIMHVRDHWSTDHYVIDRAGIMCRPGAV